MVWWPKSAGQTDEAMRGVAPELRGAMTLHRVTIAAFAVLLALGGIGSLMARQAPAAPLESVESVELSDDPAETRPAVGGEIEEVATPDLTDAEAAGPDVATAEVLVTEETAPEEAPAAEVVDDDAPQAAVEGLPEDEASDDEAEAGEADFEDD
jgi:hypothetical protein